MIHRTIERVCIVGTADSWKLTPWRDPGMHVQSLNDAYRLPGFVRADSWVDLHPINKFFHPPSDQPVFAHQVPPGHYVRPAAHVEWLAQQATTIPVYLHPDYLQHYPEAAKWMHARPFPKAEIEAVFGRYFTSSPAWMMAMAMLGGAREIWITGVHLATEHEYVEQRPQFEYLMGRFLGGERLKLVEKDGLRYYETKDRLLVLPKASPLLASPFQYGFEVRPASYVAPLKWELHKYQVKAQRELATLKQKPWWMRKRPILERLTRYEAFIADTQEQMARVQAQIGA